VLDGNGSLSFSVLDWLHEQNVVLVRIGWDGKSTVVLGGSGSPTNAEKLRWQFELERNSERGIEFASRLISEKLEASKHTLLASFPNSELRERAVSRILQSQHRLSKPDFESINEILTIEGQCASGYFEAWRGVEMRWSGLGRKPIPTAWHIYDQRSSILTGKRPENYKAAHPLNAMLNYGYAVLEAETRIRLVADGYDPRIGILHVGRKREKQDSFVFDLMEPLRPVVDEAILNFVANNSFSAADFVLRKDGVCRLSPQLAQAVSRQAHLSLSGKTTIRESLSPKN
jgi:CRISPR-associated protein Cas1